MNVTPGGSGKSATSIPDRSIVLGPGPPRTEKPLTCLQPMKGSSPLTFTSPLTHEIRIRSSASLSTLTTSVPAAMECVTVAEAEAGATSKTRAIATMPVATEFWREGSCRRTPRLLVVSWSARCVGGHGTGGW